MRVRVIFRRTSPAAIPPDDSENATCRLPYDVRSGDMWSARMEIWNRPEARTDFRSGETNAPADWYRANKVRLIRATRAARNESGTGRPSNLLARRSSPGHPRAE